MMGFGTTELVLIAFVLLLIAAPIVLIIVGALLWSRKNDNSRRPCPYCAESIKVDATMCRFCGKDLA